LKGFTVRAFEAMAGDIFLQAALWNSLRIAGIVSLVATILGLMAAIALTRYRLPGGRPLLAAIMVPLVIPSIILGIALLVILRKGLDAELSLWTIGAGHVLICIPFALLVLMSRLEGFDRSLEEASADLGERPWMTFWRVTFPLALPGIVSSLLMCFTVSFDEFVLAFFLSGTEATLPLFLWGQLKFPTRLPMTLALGTSILIASTILVILSEMLRRRGMMPGDKPSL
jgi:spermidine/putrescine transport system permease protein